MPDGGSYKYSLEKLSRVKSLEISSNEYELLREAAKECRFKYMVPSITEILRYLVKNSIKTRFPQYSQTQKTTDGIPLRRRTSYVDTTGPSTANGNFC